MKVIKPPEWYKGYESTTVFLAGSIEEGRAENWQSRVHQMFSDDERIIIFDPRRDNWDWETPMEADNPVFANQVNWELDHLEAAGCILFYFDPNTKSPISLFELGIFGSRFPEKVVVVCSEGFWRKGNVDIVCRRFGIRQYASLEEAVDFVKGYV